MKFRKFNAVVVLTIFLIAASGCKVFNFNNPQRKAEKQQKRETKKAEKEHKKGVKRQYDIQSKDTKKRMKKNLRKTKKRNKKKKPKSRWNCT